MMGLVCSRDAFRQQKKEYLSHVCLLYGKFQLHSLKQTAKFEDQRTRVDRQSRQVHSDDTRS